MQNKIQSSQFSILQTKQRIEDHRPQKLILNNHQNLKNNKWVQCKILGQNIPIRSYSAACTYRSQLYIYGGLRIYNGILADFNKINLNQNENKYEWKVVENKYPQLYPGPRAKHALINYQDKIFLIGGIKSNFEVSNQIYVYYLQHEIWNQVVPKGQELPSIQSFGNTIIEDRIYIIGGYNGDIGSITNTVYQYNITNNNLKLLIGHQQKLKSKNIQIVEIPVPRLGVGCDSDGSSKIYIFGGKGYESRLNDFWVFDTDKKQFFQIQQKGLEHPSIRSGHSLTYYDQKIYIFGGIHQITWQLDDLYIFDIKNNRWIALEEDSARKKQILQNEPERKLSITSKNLKKKSSYSPYPYRKKSYLNYIQNQGNNGCSIQNRSPYQISKFLNQERIIDPNSPSKIQEQKKKQFLMKKSQMLKDFQIPDKQKQKYINIQHTSQAILNSISIIGNSMFKLGNLDTNKNKNNSNKISEFGRISISKFLQPLSNNAKIVYNKKPCARDGHNAVLIDNQIIFFGGDRHQMSFNDVYKLNIKSLLQYELSGR